MKMATSYEEDRQLTFDSYCKKILKNEAINIQREYQRLNEIQTSFSDLSTQQLAKLSVYDEYSTDYSSFKVLEYDIAVKDELLAEALQELPEKKRDIVLLSYFLDYSDVEIAELLHLLQRTVGYHRTTALEKLKTRLEKDKNGKKTHST